MMFPFKANPVRFIRELPDGQGANHHLRQSLVFLNVPTMQQPEAYIGHADKLFDEHGKLVNDGTRNFLQQYMQAFANWVERTRS